MSRHVLRLLLTCAVVLAAGCGEDKSPAGPNSPDSFPVASTPERFVALLDSAYDTMDLTLYRSLFDSVFEFHQLSWYVESGEPSSWGFAEEMEIAERMFSGEPNMHGQRVSGLDLGIGIDTFVVEADSGETDSGAAASYLVTIGVQLTVHLDTVGMWDSDLGFVRGRGEITLRPDRRRPGHLVAVRQRDTGTYKENPEAAGEHFTWGWVKYQFRYGEETPESFLARFARKYGAHFGYSGYGDYAPVHHRGYEFHLLPRDVEVGCPEVINLGQEYRVAGRLAARWRNPKGVCVKSVVLRLDPESIVEDDEAYSGRPPEETWWSVAAGYDLEVVFGVPGGVDETTHLRGDQVFVIRPFASGSAFQVYRQYDQEPEGASEFSWGYFESMFLPETPEDFIGRFAAAYRARDDSAYGICLHEEFTFEAKPMDPGDPAPTWDRFVESKIADRMFTGWANAAGQSVSNISLSVTQVAAQTTSVAYPGRPAGETWYEVTGKVSLSAAIDEGGGLQAVSYDASSNHTFIVCPDPGSPTRMVLYRQSDPEPLDYGPAWEEQGKADDEYVELDADGTPEDGPDHLQVAVGETLLVDCWMRGVSTIGAWWITVCQSNDALEFLGADYHVPDNWTESAPTVEYQCPTLHAGASRDLDAVGLPWLGATLKYKVVRDNTYVSLEVDASNTGWASVDFSTGGVFLDIGGAKFRVGRPTQKPSSWGSTKSLFR